VGETIEYYVGEGDLKFKFTWDEDKAKETLVKHGISFPVACWALLNPVNFVEEQEQEEGELRIKLIAFPKAQDCSSLITVIFTEREDSQRLITAWKATAPERKRYEEANSVE
jgi:hypothetical protein